MLGGVHASQRAASAGGEVHHRLLGLGLPLARLLCKGRMSLHVSNLQQTSSAAKRKTKKYGDQQQSTHQLVKRLLHIDAALRRRLKERHPKALRKVTPLLGRHLAVINEIALRG